VCTGRAENLYHEDRGGRASPRRLVRVFAAELRVLKKLPQTSSGGRGVRGREQARGVGGGEEARGPGMMFYVLLYCGLCRGEPDSRGPLSASLCA